MQPPPRDSFDKSTAEGDTRIGALLDGIAPPPASAFTGTPPREPAAVAKPAEATPAADSPSWLSGIGRALKSGADAVVDLASRVEFAPGAVSAKASNQAAAIQAGPPPPHGWGLWGWIAGGLATVGLILLLRPR